MLLVNCDSSGGGVDYDSNPINATFSAGSTSAMVNVPVTMDGIVERTETFGLSFTIPSSLHGQVMEGAITTAVAIITDDTSKEISAILNKVTPIIIIIIIHLISCYGGIQ